MDQFIAFAFYAKSFAIAILVFLFFSFLSQLVFQETF